jgi:hypothetical protein
LNTTTASTSLFQEPLTLAKLEETIQRIRALGTEPVEAYMVANGFDPKKGGRMILPESMKDDFGPFGAPWFVRFSKIVTDQAVMFIDTFGATVDSFHHGDKK